MLVLNVTACPAGLRGDISKWLMEIAPGTFVGRPSARIREYLWERVTELSRDGRAVLVYSFDNEAGLEYRVHNGHWRPRDFDGLVLMQRPAAPSKSQRRTGWSTARNVRRSQRY